MDQQLKEAFERQGKLDIYERLPTKLMTKKREAIKKALKSLSTSGPEVSRLTRSEYIQLWMKAQVIKRTSARKATDDHSKYVPLHQCKAVIKKLRSGADKTIRNKYVKNAAEEYHKLRNAFLDSSNNPINPASSGEINRFASWLVGYNDPELDDNHDGTVSNQLPPC